MTASIKKRSLKVYRVKVGPIVSKGASPTEKREIKRAAASAAVAAVRKKERAMDQEFIIEIVGLKKPNVFKVTVKGNTFTIEEYPLKETE
jgi:hypothetical protein